MSGIYIPGMEMPKRDATFLVHVNGDQIDLAPPRKYCDEYKREKKTYKLVPVPDHGRLIDADALLETEAQHWITEYNSDGYAADEIGAYTMAQIDAMPTIIPADKGAGE